MSADQERDPVVWPTAGAASEVRATGAARGAGSTPSTARMRVEPVWWAADWAAANPTDEDGYVDPPAPWWAEERRSRGGGHLGHAAHLGLRDRSRFGGVTGPAVTEWSGRDVELGEVAQLALLQLALRDGDVDVIRQLASLPQLAGSARAGVLEHRDVRTRIRVASRRDLTRDEVRTMLARERNRAVLDRLARFGGLPALDLVVAHAVEHDRPSMLEAILARDPGWDDELSLTGPFSAAEVVALGPVIASRLSYQESRPRDRWSNRRAYRDRLIGWAAWSPEIVAMIAASDQERDANEREEAHVVRAARLSLRYSGDAEDVLEVIDRLAERGDHRAAIAVVARALAPDAQVSRPWSRRWSGIAPGEYDLNHNLLPFDERARLLGMLTMSSRLAREGGWPSTPRAQLRRMLDDALPSLRRRELDLDLTPRPRPSAMGALRAAVLDDGAPAPDRFIALIRAEGLTLAAAELVRLLLLRDRTLHLPLLAATPDLPAVVRDGLLVLPLRRDLATTSARQLLEAVGADRVRAILTRLGPAELPRSPSSSIGRLATLHDVEVIDWLLAEPTAELDALALELPLPVVRASIGAYVGLLERTLGADLELWGAVDVLGVEAAGSLGELITEARAAVGRAP